MSYHPTPAQLVAHQFTTTSSSGILVFTRHDKHELSFVSLHSTAEPGRFALLLGYQTVFRGTVPDGSAFRALLWQHGWQPVCVPASWEFNDWHRKQYPDIYRKPKKTQTHDVQRNN